MSTTTSIRQLIESYSSDKRNYRIASALVAYACGDAFGYAYEFEPITNGSVPNQLLTKTDWPAGGVSDDTLLSLMTIECLDAPSAEIAGKLFLEKLRAAAPSLRGLGPTTRNALGLSVKESEQHLIGISNGGLMRTALLGLAFTDQTERHTWVRILCAATHPIESAIAPALAMADKFAEVLDKTVPQTEIPDFVAPADGVSLDPAITLKAAIAAADTDSVFTAFENAVHFGGDTDTVCALAGALVAIRHPNTVLELPWLDEVGWDEIPNLNDCIDRIIKRSAHGKST
jgi:ADP-ribosylglycohydrolase